jgi:hypothetical protein
MLINKSYKFRWPWLWVTQAIWFWATWSCWCPRIEIIVAFSVFLYPTEKPGDSNPSWLGPTYTNLLAHGQRSQKMKYKVGSYFEGHCSHDIVWDFPCPILILLSGLNSKALAWGHTWILGRAHNIFMCKAPSLTEFESALKLPTDLWRQR